MALFRLSHSLLLVSALACAAPSLGQPGWGRSDWGRSDWRGSDWRGSDWRGSDWRGSGWGASRIGAPRAPAFNRERDQREGQVDSAQFMADDAGDRLGQGIVTLTTISGTVDSVDDSAAYEAAMIDQLVKAGYDTLAQAPEDSGQIAEIRIVRDVLVPPEGKRKPVSGEMMVGTGTHGSMMGMALAVDLSKPKTALVSTRLEARLLDKATGKRLWEGRAEIATREGDSRWDEQAIAARLTETLFERFPNGGEKVAAR